MVAGVAHKNPAPECSLNRSTRATLSTAMQRMRIPAAPQFVWPPNNPHTGLGTPCAVERTIAAPDPGPNR
jgi:hypothetical protein